MEMDAKKSVDQVDRELAEIDAELAEIKRKEEADAVESQVEPQSPIDAALGFFDALLGISAKPEPRSRPAAAFGAGPSSGKKKGCGGCIGRRK